MVETGHIDLLSHRMLSMKLHLQHLHSVFADIEGNVETTRNRTNMCMKVSMNVLAGIRTMFPTDCVYLT